MRDKRTGSVAAAPYPHMPGEDVVIIGLLDEVLTGNKKDTVDRIRRNLRVHTANPILPSIKKELLDLSIVIYSQRQSFANQDIDNAAKAVIDALKKPTIDDGFPYLFEDDRQIVNLLVCKRKRIENKNHNTCQIAISLRKHNPSKEMTLWCEYHNKEKNCFEITPFSQFKEGEEPIL